MAAFSPGRGSHWHRAFPAGPPARLSLSTSVCPAGRLVVPRHSVGSRLGRLPCRHSPWVPATVPGPGSGASETGERGTEMETEEREHERQRQAETKDGEGDNGRVRVRRERRVLGSGQSHSRTQRNRHSGWGVWGAWWKERLGQSPHCCSLLSPLRCSLLLSPALRGCRKDGRSGALRSVWPGLQLCDVPLWASLSSSVKWESSTSLPRTLVHT